MKKSILILIIFRSLPVFCQVSFPDSNAIWNVNTLSTNGIPKSEMLYGLYGDTLINDTLYHKMYLLKDTTLSDKNLKVYLGGFRQENQKVWFKPEYWNYPDFLLYDFTKQIGDTVWYNASLTIGSDEIHHQFGNSNKFYIVANIIIESGIKHFYLYYDNHTRDEWRYGIGSIYGPFGPINAIILSGSKYQLACFKQNDTVKYEDNLLCNKCFCNGHTGIDEENNYNWIKIFPNPTQNSLFIKIDKPYSNIKIEIIDSEGRIIYNKDSFESQIKIGDNFKGIYFIKLTIDNQLFIKKLILT
jgi:hypothetical protein